MRSSCTSAYGFLLIKVHYFLYCLTLVYMYVPFVCFNIVEIVKSQIFEKETREKSVRRETES